MFCLLSRRFVATVKSNALLLQEAHSKWNSGDIKGALAQYQGLPKTADNLYNIANCHLQLKDYSEAKSRLRIDLIEAWKESIEIEPKPDVHSNMANVYGKKLKLF